jgi:DNA-binding transcriptional ArsR family regulator
MSRMEPIVSLGDSRPLATQAEARALSHPLRLRILRLCREESLTNGELAERLGEVPATMLFHVRTLEKTGFLRREEERRGRRGAREVPYRATGKSLTLRFGPDPEGELAIIDATRAEVAEAGPEATLTLSRLASRLSPRQVDDFVRRLEALERDFVAADGLGDQSVAMMVVMHRRPKR